MITLTPVKAITLTNATITPLNDSVIEFKTPSGYYLWGAVFMFYGDRPTISSTNPTA